MQEYRTIESELNQLKDQARKCTACKAGFDTNKNLVWSLGTKKPLVMFLGEAPGRHENEQGKPFCGPAGKGLQSIVLDLKLTLNDIYIANVLKHRPDNNATPPPEWIDACSSQFLQKEIELIQPRAIVCLGKTAAQALFRAKGKEFPNKSVRGLSFLYDDQITVFCTWHPAYACIYNPEKKEELKSDIQKALAFARAQ